MLRESQLVLSQPRLSKPVTTHYDGFCKDGTDHTRIVDLLHEVLKLSQADQFYFESITMGDPPTVLARTPPRAFRVSSGHL